MATGAIPAPAFYYGRKFDMNIIADGATFPAVVLLEPDQFGFRVSAGTGQVFDSYNLFFQFLATTPVGLGEQANNREATIEQMRALAGLFIYRLNESNLFSGFNERVGGVVIVDYFDANVCGIEINITNLTDVQPRPIC